MADPDFALAEAIAEGNSACWEWADGTIWLDVDLDSGEIVTMVKHHALPLREWKDPIDACAYLADAIKEYNMQHGSKVVRERLRQPSW